MRPSTAGQPPQACSVIRLSAYPWCRVMAISLALTDAGSACELGQLLVGDSAEPGTESVEWRELALVTQALMRFLESQGVPVELQEHFRLVDAPVAHAIIDQLLDAHVDPRSVDRIAASMASADLIGDAYTASLPTGSRHRLGEYYTPAWLVQRIIQRHAPDQGVILDPACGDARFLVTLIRAGRAPADLYGVELNPVAAALARAATWIAEGQPADPKATVVWGDFLLSRSRGLRIQSTDPLLDALVETVDRLPTAEWIVGNPPWVTWRNIGSSSRARLVERFRDTSLNGLRGWHARVAAGQTDLSHLFIHEAAERVAQGGRVTFVLPRTIFTAPSSPMAIRSGRTSSGRPFRFSWVEDYSATEAFDEVRLPTVVSEIAVDEPLRFPVEWRCLTGDGSIASTDSVFASHPKDPSSSWLVDVNARVPRLHPAVGVAAVRARGGVNTGGGNGVYYVEVTEEIDDELIRIRNLVPRKSTAPTVEAVVERAFVRPLLRGRDITSWSTNPQISLIFPYGGSDIRNPLPESQLKSAAPRAYAYLSGFRSLLESRKELARWGGLWYSLFRIGPYTTDCWRVVWPHSGAQAFRSAILGPSDPAVPDQKVVLVRFDDEPSALLACAFLNSAGVRRFIAASSAIDASPSLLARLPLPAFDSSNPHLVEIVGAARQATIGGCVEERLLANLFA